MQPTGSDQFAPPRSTSRPTPRAGRLLLPFGVLGIWVFPVAIIVATNSWGPPDAEDYIRMAFGQVAGHTVAVLTALVLLGTSIRLRSRDAIIGWSLIALFVLGTAYSGLQTASERLIQIVG